jgi:organic hydroperoxide reductase OsmC/OhrA
VIYGNLIHMSTYKTTITWSRQEAVFSDNRYSRAHTWLFDGGIEVPASSSPHVVPPPMSVAAAVDPEEAFVVSLSSCHMLWFLSLAASRKWIVESYRDEAVGTLAKDDTGKFAMTVVTLRPEVVFGGERQPSAEEIQALHHRAHEECFIANSVKTDVRCEPAGLPRIEPALNLRIARAAMKDLAIALENRPGALAEMGEALGRAGVSVEGGGAWVVGGAGVAHFLFEDGTAAVQALEAAGIRVIAQRDVLVQRLQQSVPGQLGLLTRRMADAGVNIEVLYSDHNHQLVLVVDDLAKGQAVSEAWMREWTK